LNAAIFADATIMTIVLENPGLLVSWWLSTNLVLD